LKILPFNKDHLWESLTTRSGPKAFVKAERLHNRKMSLDDHQQSPFALLLIEARPRRFERTP
jgi:hypothetical protein